MGRFEKNGEKHKKININKNPQDGDLTFVLDPVEELIENSTQSVGE
jgi:hypothetical protein